MSQFNMSTPNRPVFLNLLQIHLPLTGWISIAHRITGVVLFLLLPLPLYLWQRSLESMEGYAQVALWLQQWPLRLLLLLMGWWFFHHLVAGVRFLLMDLERGVSLTAARRSARAVVVVDLIYLLFAGWWL
ncbi:MAG: succinate dehydrogenase, cytochrome b556 subunit [Pseudomonadota bacterium]